MVAPTPIPAAPGGAMNQENEADPEPIPRTHIDFERLLGGEPRRVDPTPARAQANRVAIVRGGPDSPEERRADLRLSYTRNEAYVRGVIESFDHGPARMQLMAVPATVGFRVRLFDPDQPNRFVEVT